MSKTITIDLELWNRLTRERLELREALEEIFNASTIGEAGEYSVGGDWYNEAQDILTRTQEG